MFLFEASPSNKRDIEIYGTLPHKKKTRSAGAMALKSGESPVRSANQSLQDPVRQSVRRAEGFSRLLEFTRQQQETCQVAAFDVTQSVPVYANAGLCSIEETKDDEECADDEVCLLETSQSGTGVLREDDPNPEEGSNHPGSDDEVCLLETPQMAMAEVLREDELSPPDTRQSPDSYEDKERFNGRGMVS
jgi:hypothetical protein